MSVTLFIEPLIILLVAAESVVIPLGSFLRAVFSFLCVSLARQLPILFIFFKELAFYFTDFSLLFSCFLFHWFLLFSVSLLPLSLDLGFFYFSELELRLLT